MDDLVDRMKLANGTDDCTCNVADHSPNVAEHDEYCAFPLLQIGAAKIEHLRAALAKISDPLTLEVEGIGMTRALRIITTMQSIADSALA